MSLTSELLKVGLTKAKLAEILNVSTKTVSRMGEEVSPEVRVVLNSLKEPDYKWRSIPRKLFDGVGRGFPIKVEDMPGRYVLISCGGEVEDSVVSEKDWKARLDYTCKHGREGWSCKVCLK